MLEIDLSLLFLSNFKARYSSFHFQIIVLDFNIDKLNHTIPQIHQEEITFKLTPYNYNPKTTTFRKEFFKFGV